MYWPAIGLAQAQYRIYYRHGIGPELFNQCHGRGGEGLLLSSCTTSQDISQDISQQKKLVGERFLKLTGVSEMSFYCK